MENKDFNKALLRRLNTLIILMLDSTSSEHSQPITKKIEQLSKIGLQAAEIGEIMGKKTNYVTAVLNEAKKRKRK